MSEIKCYTELSKLSTYEERLKYLKLDGVVGNDTFGWDRYLNQDFYKSQEWKRIRNSVIIRDLGCDLGIEGRPINHNAIIHHMNPIEPADIINRSEFLINPEYLITVTLRTHNTIHYGSGEITEPVLVERRPGDTCPWR